MKSKTLPWGLLAGLLILSSAQAEEKVKKEKATFDGAWVAVSVIRDGKELPPDQVEKFKLVVKGNSYTFSTGDHVIEGTHKLNPNKDPKEIDAVRTNGPEKDEPLRGIYELTRDHYKVCFAPPGKERPTKFESKPGSGDRLIEMKRQSP